MSTDVVGAVVRVHGGVKFYNGAAKAARAYVDLALEAGGKDNITVVIVPVPAGGPRARHD